MAGLNSLNVSRPPLNQRASVFMLCYDLKNFSRVAEVLHISQPAVSKSIKAFEEQVGVKLFTRTKPLQPTPEAALLYNKLRDITSDLNEFFEELRIRRENLPSLRLGMLESLSVTLGVSLARELRKDHGDIAITSGSANVLIPRLQNRTADLILTNNLYTNTKAISRKRIFEEPTLLIFPKGYLSKHRVRIQDWKDLKHLPLPYIGYWNECGAGQVNEMFLRSRGISLSPDIAVDCNMLLTTMVADGLGWGMARPTVIMENQNFSDSLDIIASPEPIFFRAVYLMWISKEFDAEASRLAKLIKNQVAAVLAPKINEVLPGVTLNINVEHQGL